MVHEANIFTPGTCVPVYGTEDVVVRKMKPLLMFEKKESA